MAALPNGQLASGSFDTTIKLWDVVSHHCLATLQGHTSHVNALAVLPNDQLASGSYDETIKLWDMGSFSCLTTLQGHTSYVLSLAALPNAQLASASRDNTIKLWDLTSLSCITTLQGHTSGLFGLFIPPTPLSLAVLPNGQLASGSDDETIKILESRTVSAKHLQPILDASKNNTSVTNLDLSNNSDIRDDIIDPLIKIFKKPGLFSILDSKPNTTLKTIDLRRTGVSKKGIKKLEKAIQSQSLSVEILADCPAEWMKIYFLIIFCRANRNSPFADSGLDLCKHGWIRPFLGIPSGFFAWSHQNPSSQNFSRRVTLSSSSPS